MQWVKQKFGIKLKKIVKTPLRLETAIFTNFVLKNKLLTNIYKYFFIKIPWKILTSIQLTNLLYFKIYNSPAAAQQSGSLQLSGGERTNKSEEHMVVQVVQRS